MLANGWCRLAAGKGAEKYIEGVKLLALEFNIS
jgi:hypothetical protein